MTVRVADETLRSHPVNDVKQMEMPLFLHHRHRLTAATIVGLTIVLFYLTLAIFGEAIAPLSYTEQNFSVILQAPSLQYPFGTDQFGRDIFSRVIVGSRSIILLASAATLLSLLLGAGIGLIAGYAGGLWDEVLMRGADVLLSFPALLLALLIISTLGSDMIYLGLTIAVVFAPGIARVVRSETLNLSPRNLSKQRALPASRPTALPCVICCPISPI